MKTQFFSSNSEAALLEGARQAQLAIGRGQVILIPTDTNFSIVADAFNPRAIGALRKVKGMARQAPLSVFVPDFETLSAVVAEVSPNVRALIEHFWPGPLTVLMATGDSIAWNLGETSGTVALRMPKNNIALNLLRHTGPLAQSAASKVDAAASRKTEAYVKKTFDGSVALVVGAGSEKPAYQPSTVVDATLLSSPKSKFKILREGLIPRKEIFAAVSPELFA